MRLSPELDEGWVGSRRRGRWYDVKTEMFPVSIKCKHFQEANIGNKPGLGVNIPQSPITALFLNTEPALSLVGGSLPLQALIYTMIK